MLLFLKDCNKLVTIVNLSGLNFGSKAREVTYNFGQGGLELLTFGSKKINGRAGGLCMRENQKMHDSAIRDGPYYFC